MSEVEVTMSSPNCGNALLPASLMAPRYKVIADYPDNPFAVDHILNLKNVGGFWRFQWADYDGLRYEMESHFIEYPHLFKKLEWWEERKVEEMPEYFKHKTGQVLRVQKWQLEDKGREGVSANNLYWFIEYIKPSTKEEYLLSNGLNK
jgi:hypothetical protein